MISKLKIAFSLSGLATLFLLTSCDKETVSPSDNIANAAIEVRSNGNGNSGGNGKGKGKNNDGDGGGNMDSIAYAATYQITEYDEFDPLYRFSVSESGDLMLLQTDSTVTHWGTNYWGAWAEPFTFGDGIVHYFKGLTEVTYEFTALPDELFDVSETLSVSDYLSGNVTTTFKHIGVYSKIIE